MAGRFLSSRIESSSSMKFCQRRLTIDFSPIRTIRIRSPSIERIERTRTISPRGSYIGCPRILSCFSPSRDQMMTKKKKNHSNRRKKKKLRDVNKRRVKKKKTKEKSHENDVARGWDRRANRRRSAWKERVREENGTKGRKGHPSKTRRSFRTNSTTTDESLLACLLAQFPGMEPGTMETYIHIYIYNTCTCISVEYVCIGIHTPRKHINTSPFPVPLSVSRVFVLRIRHEDVYGERNEWCLDDLSLRRPAKPLRVIDRSIFIQIFQPFLII